MTKISIFVYMRTLNMQNVVHQVLSRFRHKRRKVKSKVKVKVKVKSKVKEL